VRVLLTGATGFVGSEVLRQLSAARHEVWAIVRSPSAAAHVTAAGAQPVLGSVADPAVVAAAARGVDGIVHTAAPPVPGPDLDRVFVPAVLDAITGTPTRYVHSSGAWVLGSGAHLTERSRPAPPLITAWRLPLEERLRASATSTTIVAPGLVYDDEGRGLGPLLCPERGVARLIGDGRQRWSTVHVRDLAALYLLALEAPDHHALLLGVADCPTAGALASSAAGGGRVEQETLEESRARLGADLVDALLLDQGVEASATQSMLGWRPKSPSATQVLPVRQHLDRTPGRTARPPYHRREELAR
jgi:nucleoside-diphosphate-sugar epimerase